MFDWSKKTQKDSFDNPLELFMELGIDKDLDNKEFQQLRYAPDPVFLLIHIF
jgi:hypothetical protein